MSMLDQVLAARRAQDAETARRASIVREGMLARWRLYLATWNRVQAAMREIEGVMVRMRVKVGRNREPCLYETLPLLFEAVKPPDPDKPGCGVHGGQMMKLYTRSEQIRKPLSYIWVAPPPPKRKPRGWTPPQPPPGEPYLTDLLSVSCSFDSGYWEGHHDGKYSRPLDDFAPGKKVWKSYPEYSAYNKDPGSEAEILAWIAHQVAMHLPAGNLPDPAAATPPTRNVDIPS